MDYLASQSVSNFGYTQCIIIPSQKEESIEKKIEENFVESIPSLGASASRNLKTYHYFPKLGVYLGYLTKEGVTNIEKTESKVYGVDYFSLIRPKNIKPATPKDKYTWGLKHLNILDLWEKGINGKGVKVGHLDTGVEGTHKAFVGNRIKSFAEFDSNGEINFESNNSNDAFDSRTHGTHTAGIICGGEVDGMTIGVAPKCELYVGIVIEGGDPLARLLNGLNWCLEKQVKIINMSLGKRGYTPYFIDIMKTIRRQGTLPICAIGNEGPGITRSPGNYPEALSVGAIDQDNHIWFDSSSIKFERDLEPFQPNIVAPGVNIISASPGGNGTNLTSQDGTSMATAFVSGIAALLASARDDITMDNIEKTIFETCSSLTGEDKERYGFGLINPQKAISRILE